MMLRPILPALIFASLALARAADETPLPLGQGVTLTVVRIEPGGFTQGSQPTEANRGADETAREVMLTKAFYLGKFPVTRGQFARFVQETNFRTEAEKGTSGGFGLENGKLVQKKEYTWRNPGFPQTDDDPVVIVTWDDAKAFTGWLSRKTGTQFDLPTEAQWEFACRAGTRNATFVGAPQPDAVAWHRGNSELRTHPVGQKALNPWGLGDMQGNVWEWCADWYAPYATGLQTDPRQDNANLSDKPRRVLRGGSFLKDATGCRVAARFRNDPLSRNADNGFRVMAYKLPTNATLERAEAIPGALPSTADAATTSSSDTPAKVTPSTAAKAAGTLVNLLCSLGCIGITVLIILWIVRKFVKGGGSSTSVPNVGIPGVVTNRPNIPPGAAPRARIVDDGFWIEGGSVPVGTVLVCRYVVNGAQQESGLTYDARPGGQFIFTGQKPTSVTISVQSSVPGTQPFGGRSAFDADDDYDRRRRSTPSAY